MLLSYFTEEAYERLLHDIEANASKYSGTVNFSGRWPVKQTLCCRFSASVIPNTTFRYIIAWMYLRFKS